jgi:hypothetical protein
MAMGEVITLVANQEANTGSQTMATAGTSQILLERLVDV